MALIYSDIKHIHINVDTFKISLSINLLYQGGSKSFRFKFTFKRFDYVAIYLISLDFLSWLTRCPCIWNLWQEQRLVKSDGKRRRQKKVRSEETHFWNVCHTGGH